MAETAILQPPQADETVKTLEDRQKDGGMHVDIPPTAAAKSDEQHDKVNDKIPQLSKDGEEKENKGLVKEAAEVKEEEKDVSMQLDSSSPCSSAEVSLNESPVFMKLDGSKNTSTPVDEALATHNGLKKRRRPNKHKGGKNHRRIYKPYSKLSWDERKERDDKETIRATKKRDDLFASGLPMAPYNTTQFLMEDQDQPSPQATPANAAAQVQEQQSVEVHDDRSSSKEDAGSASYESSDGEHYDSRDDEDKFMEREFNDTYDYYNAERLQLLTKEELVKEYIELEEKKNRLETEVKELTKSSTKGKEKGSTPVKDASVKELASLEEEMKRVREENAKLSRENEFLKVAAGKLKA